MDEDTDSVIRYAIIGSMVIATGIAMTCPCKNPYLACHIVPFTVTTGIPLALALYINFNTRNKYVCDKNTCDKYGCL